MEKPSQMHLACFKFIYNLGKRAAQVNSNSVAIAYLDRIKSGEFGHTNANAFEPSQYSAVINISKTIYRLLVRKPLEINILDDTLNKVYPVLRKSMTFWGEIIDPDTNLKINLDYTREISQAAIFLIETLFEQNKLKEADVAPIALIDNSRFCELATALFSDHVLPDIRPEFKKNAGDTTFGDVIRIFEQKYLGKPVIKQDINQRSELSDLLNDIVEKCWARVDGPEFAGRITRMRAYYETGNSIYSGCHADGNWVHNFFALNYTSYKGVYRSFKIDLLWNKDLELYYRNGKDIRVSDATIEGFLYAHFKLSPKRND